MTQKMTSPQAKFSAKPGFTLIELVLVIVIVGIVALIALPLYNDITWQARVAATKASQAALNEGLQLLDATYRINEQPLPWITGNMDPWAIEINDIFMGENFPVNQMLDSHLVDINIMDVSSFAVNACADYLEAQVGTFDWIMFGDSREIMATTPDCTLEDPSTW